MNTPTFELDRPSAASNATLDVDSPMMQAPEGPARQPDVPRRECAEGAGKTLLLPGHRTRESSSAIVCEGT